MIIVLGGLVQAARLVSYGLGNRRCDHTTEAKALLVKIIRWTGARIRDSKGIFSKEDVEEAVNQLELQDLLGHREIMRKTRSYAAGIYMGVVAHEMGHLSLGILSGIPRILTMKYQKTGKEKPIHSHPQLQAPVRSQITLFWEAYTGGP